MEELQNLGRPLRVIGRYALYGKLAAGGMATVHFGRLLGPAGFSRTVAIKCLHPQFAKDPEFVAMFLDEARLAARIQHPNVVATVDVVARADELFLVMDYIRGESFSRLLRASRKQGIEVSLGVIASVATGMLHGLHAAHEVKDEQGHPLSVVHRDVSPQNVLVGVDGVTRVLDFGVAKAAARVQVTRDGQMKGKLSYMAPEQLLGKGVDRRVDIFAAGIVLWEALTGKRLFDAEEASEVLRMILHEELPPPSAVVPSIPREIDAIVMKALTRDTSQRYQTARAFAIALEQATQLSSTREVGEWVERVAGDTLLNRENTVAEIESISSVSTVSLVTGSAPGFTKTLDGRVPPSVRQLVKEIEERGPPRIYEDGNATRIHVPRATPQIPRATPQIGRSKPPPPPRRAGTPGRTLLGLGEGGGQKPPPSQPKHEVEDEKTGIYDPSRHALDGDESEKTGIFDPSRHALEDDPGKSTEADEGDEGDEGEKTGIFDPARHALDESPEGDEDEKTGIFDPAQHGFSDDEATGIYDPSLHALDAATDALMSGAPAAVGERTQPRNRRPTPQDPSDRAVLGETPSVLVQDHTDPEIFRPSAPAVGRGIAWLWADPSQRLFRVALVAGAVALVGGFGVAASRPKPPRVTSGAPVASTPPLAPPPVVAVAPPEPTVHAVDPSSLPIAPPDDEDTAHPQKVAAAPPAPSEAPPVPSTELVKSATPAAVVGASAPHAPSPVKAASKPVVATPEPKAVTPPPEPKVAILAPEPKAVTPPPEPKAAPPPAKPASTPASCAQPYYVDDNGIRRIKAECL